MVKDVVQNGVIVPRTPLPADWQEGTEVEVEKTAPNGAVENGVHPTDAWMDEVDAIDAVGLGVLEQLLRREDGGLHVLLLPALAERVMADVVGPDVNVRVDEVHGSFPKSSEDSRICVI